MDDCSPDNTAEVATTFQDARIKHIRNDHNLGHLRNYNKGVGLSVGKYVWLISADDRLRRPYVLERYVNVMEEHPGVGYVFCPGVGLQDGVETSLLEFYYYGSQDKLFNGRHFITEVLRKGGGLLSPAVMVRKACYSEIGMFPLDMPHQGDMYLWFIWALEYDVAYLSEPMVNYRSHDINMMKDLLSRVPEIAFSDEVNVLWRTKRRAEKKAFDQLTRDLETSLAIKYAAAVALTLYGDNVSCWGMSISQCETALGSNTISMLEHKRLLAKFYASLADSHFWHGAFRRALRDYTLALHHNWCMPKVWFKLLTASMGPGGLYVRYAGLQIRQRQKSCYAGSSTTLDLVRQYVCRV
jgi:hypothetical protein